MDAFLAFVSKFLRAAAVAVEGLKMEMYASMSDSGGRSLCRKAGLQFSFFFDFVQRKGRRRRRSKAYRLVIFITIPSVQVIDAA